MSRKVVKGWIFEGGRRLRRASEQEIAAASRKALAKQAKKKKKEGKSRQRERPMVDYAQRGRSLRALGFETYPDYLASKLWTEIRADVLARDHERCRCCNNKATQVHHFSYDTDTLAGRDLRWLAAVCSGCHLAIEYFPDGKKRSVREVGEQYRTMRRGLKSKVHSGLYLHSEPADQLSAEFFAIVRA